MPNLYLAIGSNINPNENISAALETLREHFDIKVISNTYESNALGFEGPNFHNLVIQMTTALSLSSVTQILLEIERQYGRATAAKSFTSRQLDLDLLLYDKLVIANNEIELPRSDILKYPFVLRPLSEIAGEEIHPLLQQTYKELWDQFNKNMLPLHLVTQGVTITH